MNKEKETKKQTKWPKDKAKCYMCGKLEPVSESLPFLMKRDDGLYVFYCGCDGWD